MDIQVNTIECSDQEDWANTTSADLTNHISSLQGFLHWPRCFDHTHFRTYPHRISSYMSQQNRSLLHRVGSPFSIPLLPIITMPTQKRMKSNKNSTSRHFLFLIGPYGSDSGDTSFFPKQQPMAPNRLNGMKEKKSLKWSAKNRCKTFPEDTQDVCSHDSQGCPFWRHCRHCMDSPAGQPSETGTAYNDQTVHRSTEEEEDIWSLVDMIAEEISVLLETERNGNEPHYLQQSVNKLNYLIQLHKQCSNHIICLSLQLTI